MRREDPGPGVADFALMASVPAAKRWVPPALIDAWRRRSGTWAGLDVSPTQVTNRAQSRGYTDPLILDRVEAATRKALIGAVRYERDGLTFDDQDVYWPVFGPLMAVRRSTPGVLRVLDLGGSLGSKWLQHREWAELLSPLQWAVVEQPHYVGRAAELAYPDSISFHSSLGEANEAISGVDVALFSSSLQYFDNPPEILHEAMELTDQAVVVDRATVSTSERESLGMQVVTLYERPVRYPCWLLSWPRLIHVVEQQFRHVGTWQETLSYPIYPRQTDAFFGGVFGFGRRE